GDDGLTIAARNTLAGLPLLRNERAFYYLVFACLLGTYLFCRALVGSRFGRVVRGAKENPVRMATIGFDVYRFQLATYVIAGALGCRGPAGGTFGLPPRQCHGIRQPRLHVVATLGRVDRDGAARRPGLARRRHHRGRRLSPDRGMALPCYRGLEGDLRAGARARRPIRARRPHRPHARPGAEVRSCLTRCCTWKSCASRSARSSSPTS